MLAPWGKRGYGDGSTSYTGLSSIGLLPWLPGFPLWAFPTTISSLTSPRSVSAVNSSSHSGIAPQSPNSSSQLLSLPGDLHLCPAYVWLQQGLHLFRLPQISCFTFSFQCFSSDSDNCPDVGIRPLLQFPYPPRAGPVLLTLLFFPLVPSSYRVLHSSIYYLLLVGYSCLLSASDLHAVLCLKVYSWCIHGERCTTPCPPTPPPSCPPLCSIFCCIPIFLSNMQGMWWYPCFLPGSRYLSSFLLYLLVLLEVSQIY